MIRRSTIIGFAALVLSLTVHLFGIALTTPDASSPDTADQGAESITLDSDFADLADTSTPPVVPEEADRPEPPPETPPEPAEAQPPTSQALVASANPQATSTPDLGTANAVQPTVTDPVPPGTDNAEGAENHTPSDEAETSAAETAPTPSVDTAVQDAAAGAPDRDVLPSTPVTPPFAPSAATAPVAAPPVSSFAATPLPDVIAALPPETRPTETTPTLPDAQDPVADSAPSGTGVATSARPQQRPERQFSQPLGETNGAADQPTQRAAPTELIESPLTAFRRDGTNLFAGRRSGSQSTGALGPGNATVTNYAGQVLVHLNRVPPVAVSARGWARVLFRINPDGTLAGVDIIDGSGSPEIERAAREHVQRGSPFPPPPSGQSRTLNFFYRIAR